MQIPSDEATSADECVWLGSGGDDLLFCDYVSVNFSEPVSTEGLAIEVTPDVGETLTLANACPVEPCLGLLPEEASAPTEATGFRIVQRAGPPHYSPAELSILVQLDGQTIADTTIMPSYSCVELSCDDWCWQGAPETMTVTP